MANTSGEGKGAVVPEEVKGLCWGAFLWTFIWGIGNRVWLSLIVLVPVVGWIMAFVLLFKGRQWAWENKTWESVEEFNRVQRKWTKAWFILMGGVAALGIAAAILLAMLSEKSPPPPVPAPVSAPAPKPTPKATPPAAAAAPKSPPESVAEAPKAPPVAAAPAPAPAPASAPVAAPPVSAQPAAAPASDRPKRARRAPAPGPELLSTANVPVPEPKVFMPKYNDLMTAVLKPDRAGAAELLDLGRWVDKPDANGVTPLIAAVRLRDTGMVELLLSRGANPNMSVRSGLTPLAIARLNSDAAMASLLQRNGAR